jgi:hypothetical protein
VNAKVSSDTHNFAHAAMSSLKDFITTTPRDKRFYNFNQSHHCWCVLCSTLRCGSLISFLYSALRSLAIVLRCCDVLLYVRVMKSSAHTYDVIERFARTACVDLCIMGA